MARAENLAIMFVDMAGFAERTARQSRQQNKAIACCSRSSRASAATA
jgi:hypothetical protein